MFEIVLKWSIDFFSLSNAARIFFFIRPLRKKIHSSFLFGGMVCFSAQYIAYWIIGKKNLNDKFQLSSMNELLKAIIFSHILW